MKILILTEFFPSGKDLRFTGGVEARNYYVSKYLSKKHKVTIITTRLKKSAEKEKIDSVSIIRIGQKNNYVATTGSIFQRISFFFNCLTVARSVDADIVEGTNFITHTLAYAVARNKKIPSVAWYPDVWIGSWFKNAGITGILGEIIERINLKLKFNRYIAISKVTEQKLSKFTNKKIDVIPCAVDNVEFKRKIKKQKGKIICISRLAKYKNIKNLVLAFALISKNNHVSLEIVGRGPEEKSLKDLIKNLGIKSKVRIVSNLERKELIKHLMDAEIFCLPTSVEGFGISIIESAAAKTPYVVTDLPVIREVTKKYLGGLAVKLDDIYDLSKKINKLLTNKKLYDEKSKECLKLAKIYSWEKVAKQTEKTYLSLK